MGDAGIKDDSNIVLLSWYFIGVSRYPEPKTNLSSAFGAYGVIDCHTETIGLKNQKSISNMIYLENQMFPYLYSRFNLLKQHDLV